MGQEKMKQKLLLAVIQGDDYTETVDDLNRGGFFATVLSSTGGFLKTKPSPGIIPLPYSPQCKPKTPQTPPKDP